MKKLMFAIFALALVFSAPVAFACDGGSCAVVADGSGNGGGNVVADNGGGCTSC